MSVLTLSLQENVALTFPVTSCCYVKALEWGDMEQRGLKQATWTLGCGELWSDGE